MDCQVMHIKGLKSCTYSVCNNTQIRDLYTTKVLCIQIVVL